jgi:hypothetical protein
MVVANSRCCHRCGNYLLREDVDIICLCCGWRRSFVYGSIKEYQGERVIRDLMRPAMPFNMPLRGLQVVYMLVDN